MNYLDESSMIHVMSYQALDFLTARSAQPNQNSSNPLYPVKLELARELSLFTQTLPKLTAVALGLGIEMQCNLSPTQVLAAESIVTMTSKKNMGAPRL